MPVWKRWGLALTLILGSCAGERVITNPPDFATCSDADFARGLCGGTVSPPPPPPPPPAPQGGPYPTGEAAFIAECATCHASHDGFDVAFFSYFDSTIVRRALAHVDSATAQLIVDYINGLQTPQVSEDYRAFQPGGVKLASDVAFAVNLFGSDAWPASLTDAQLLAIDPRDVPVAVDMQPWSTESPDATGGTVEWVPPIPIPSAVASFNGNRVNNAVAAYHANRTDANLVTAVVAIVDEADNLSNPAAPCKTNAPSTILACYNIHLWAANLSAVHKLRTSEFGFVAPEIYAQWWLVGDFARLNGTGPIFHSNRKWRAFMYAGWAFDPARVAAIYTTGGMGLLKRHAVFIALRSLVARAPGQWVDEDVTPIVDFRAACQSAITGTNWAYNPALFGLNHLLDRLGNGDVPPSAEKPEQLVIFNQAMTTIQPKVTSSQFTTLNNLANQVRGYLQ